MMLGWRARRAVHRDPCAARQHGQAGSGSRELVAGVGLFLRLGHPGELSPAPGQAGVSVLSDVLTRL